MDINRLCVRVALGEDATGCLGPHVIPDVLSSLTTSGSDVRVIRVSGILDASLVVDGVSIDMKLRTDGITARVVLTCGNRAVCVTPFRSALVHTLATMPDGTTVSLAHILYKQWVDSASVTSNGKLAAVVPGALDVSTWIEHTVSYVEPRSIASGIRMLACGP